MSTGLIANHLEACCQVCGCPEVRWLRVRTIARQFGCSQKRVRRMVKRGEIDPWAGMSLREVLGQVRARLLQETDGMIELDVDAIEGAFLGSLPDAQSSSSSS